MSRLITSAQTVVPRKKAQAAFVSAMAPLLLCGVAAYLTIDRLMETQALVIHTLEVQMALGDIDSALLRAARARGGYRVSKSESFWNDFEAISTEVPLRLKGLRDLTRDNVKQSELSSRLEKLATARLGLQREAIQLDKAGDNDKIRQAQTDVERRSVPVSSELTSVMQQMRQEEEHLLEVRQKASHQLFVLTVLILSSAFILAIILFSVHYRFLSTELDARREAESSARESEESLRRLTSRLLQLQDAERRNFSRELHDSLGQYLVGVKMNLEMFITQRKDSLLQEAVQLLDRSIAETRTISHLLHPPLLDEAGLASATRWYLEGFAQRSGIEVKVDLPDDVGRLSKPVELALFRVLQESLTNIHRHSESKKADVALSILAGHVVLRVRDYGKGIRPEVLKAFGSKGSNSGVGLAGMRERMHELGGQLRLQPCVPGTLVSVTIPLVADVEQDISAAD